MSTREFGFIAFATLALILTPIVGAASLGPTSDEHPPVTCDPGSFVEKVTCSGQRCDNVSITCQARPGVATGRAVWTGWFSEEGSGRGRCPAKHFVAGLACNKGWCDNVSLYCVEIPSAPATGACTDTRPTGSGAQATVSVIDNSNLDKAGQKFLASEMRCQGGWCSKLSMCVREQ
jgi:hypothetical protein